MIIVYGLVKGVYRKYKGDKIWSEELGGRGQNLNNKFKTFDFLDTLKVHIRSNYLTSIRSIYTSNKTIRKKQ